MSKPDFLKDHLTNPAFRDARSSLTVKANPGRLSLFYAEEPCGWNDLVARISGLNRMDVKWFPDTNVAILPTTEAVWDAMRVAGLDSANGAVVLTGVVEHELREWIDAPYHHVDRAASIRTALESETWIKRFRLGTSSPIARAFLGYVHLLGIRRSMAIPAVGGTSLVGTDAADKAKTMDTIKKRAGQRAVKLAKKGRDDAEKTGTVNFLDEMNCLVVIAYALLHKQDCVILTADEDVLEIFYKAQWFIDTHYRAWLAARLISNGQYGEPASVTTSARFFDGEITLYRRPTTHLNEVLPTNFDSVRVGVLYVAPNGFVRELSFPFEIQMLDMLEARGTTGGRSTDLFGRSNIHVDLGPLKPTLDGNYLGIGKDVASAFEIDGQPFEISQMDVVHAVNCCERFTLG